MSIGDESRAQAVNRLWARRAFRIHLIAFLMGSVVMLLVWATTSGDYFWPVWHPARDQKRQVTVTGRCPLRHESISMTPP